MNKEYKICRNGMEATITNEKGEMRDTINSSNLADKLAYENLVEKLENDIKSLEEDLKEYDFKLAYSKILYLISCILIIMMTIASVIIMPFLGRNASINLNINRLTKKKKNSLKAKIEILKEELNKAKAKLEKLNDEEVLKQNSNESGKILKVKDAEELKEILKRGEKYSALGYNFIKYSRVNKRGKLEAVLKKDGYKDNELIEILKYVDENPHNLEVAPRGKRRVLKRGK